MALPLLLSTSCLLMAFISSGDCLGAWSEWRGDPQHTAPYGGEELPRKGELIWSRQTGDQVLSSPAFYEGGLVIGSDDGWLHCLDPTTGEVNWRFRTEGAIQATALIKGDKAFFGSLDREFYCISLPPKGSTAQPSLIWNRTVSDQIISSAHEDDGRVYFADLSGTVHCMTVDGDHVWSEKVSDQEIWASPLLDPENAVLYIGDIGSGLYCLDMNTGKVKRSLVRTDRAEFYSSGTLGDGMLFIGTGEERALLCIDPSDLSVQWEFICDDPCYSTPNLKDGRVYFASYRYLWCVPAEDPNGDGNLSMDEVIWSSNIHGFQGGSSPLVTGDSVFIGSDDEDYRLYCLSTADGSESWNVSTKGYVYTSPALYNGSIYFGSSDRSVYCVGERPPGINMELDIGSLEIGSDNTTRISVNLTDDEGKPLEGALISFLPSSGSVSLNGEDPYEGPFITGSDGAVRVTFLPPPVSSRSTVDIDVKAEKVGLLSARSTFSIVVEPSDEGDGEGSGFEYIDKDRPLYIGAFIALIVIDSMLFLTMFGLSTFLRKIRRERA